MPISFGTNIDTPASQSNCFGDYDVPDYVLNIDVNETIDNGQTSITDHNVQNIKAGQNYNIQIETDISSLAGITIETAIIADNTLRIIVINESGENGVVIPTLKINIFKN